MRKLFDDETAQHLGYQQYWPEKKDWAIAILGVLAAGAVFVGLLVGILMLTGNWDRQFEPNPCEQYRNLTLESIPVGCIRYFN